MLADAKNSHVGARARARFGEEKKQRESDTQRTPCLPRYKQMADAPCRPSGKHSRRRTRDSVNKHATRGRRALQRISGSCVCSRHSARSQSDTAAVSRDDTADYLFPQSIHRLSAGYRGCPTQTRKERKEQTKITAEATQRLQK